MDDCLTDAEKSVNQLSATASSDEVCKALKKVMGCYPKCVCDDATVQAQLEPILASAKSADCSVKCGSAAGLRASAFAVFIAAAVALVAAH